MSQSQPISVCQHIADIMSFKRFRKCANDTNLPPPSRRRLSASRDEVAPLNIQEFLDSGRSSRNTVLYLAYGSNLSKETFKGARGIKPLSQINVQIPSLRLTFDLPGIPYTEPCFANSGPRDPENDSPGSNANANDEKMALLAQGKRGYNKDQWHKGMIGVVYEVTEEDYAHIIATEGGGSSYQDILVDCYPFQNSDPRAEVPRTPSSESFKAHTLFAPAVPPGKKPENDGGRLQRPDTSYAQPSARYLKLITDGAAELSLPYEYQDYLHSIRPYTITTGKQRIGQFVFLAVWAPIIMLIVFVLSKLFSDKHGRQPKWLQRLSGAVFKAAWLSYDGFFFKIFGDGERTLSDSDKHGKREARSTRKTTRQLSENQKQSNFEKGEL